jgi:hypothetical protein
MNKPSMYVSSFRIVDNSSSNAIPRFQRHPQSVDVKMKIGFSTFAMTNGRHEASRRCWAIALHRSAVVAALHHVAVVVAVLVAAVVVLEQKLKCPRIDPFSHMSRYNASRLFYVRVLSFSSRKFRRFSPNVIEVSFLIASRNA